MKSRLDKRSGRSAGRGETGREIDARYGLEPVFEPGGESSSSLDSACRLQAARCPYCGESFETLLDLSGGAARYVEDCPVCCRPIELQLEIGDDGELAGLTLLRTD